LTQKTLVVGITSDFLYPTHLQQEMADNMPRATMFVIDSKHGHDAFLIEIAALNKRAAAFRGDEGKILDKNIPYPPDAADSVYGTVDQNFIEAVRAALGSGSESGSETTTQTTTHTLGDTDRVLTSRLARLPYAADAGHQPPRVPDLVVLPDSTAQVASVVKLCFKHKIPITTRGAGTGLEGGAVAYSGGVVCDTKNLTQMTYNSGEKTATVGAGVLKNQLDKVRITNHHAPPA
jgi:D-lactate dehydrogenase (cytochrome)